MDLGSAIAFVCGEVCLQVFSVPESATRSCKVIPGRLSVSSGISTWLVEGGKFFTLIKAESKTLAYCHQTKTLFYAAPFFNLSENFPTQHAILCQTCVDTQPTGPPVSRLLAMDLVHPPIKCPKERGEVMRRLCLPPSIALQWAGDPCALRKFLDNGLPHKVQCMVELSADPLKPIKEISVKVPMVVQDLASLPSPGKKKPTQKRCRK